MKNLIKVLALSLALGVSAKAIPIVGSVDFAGSATLDNANVALATEVSSGFGFIIDATDDFAAEGLVFGQGVSFSFPWTFTSGAHAGLWSVGGFTFDLISSAVVQQTSSFLNVTGTGTIKHAGYDDTAGIWAFTIPNAGGSDATFSFASATSYVPDTSSTVLLIGAGLLSIGLAARRKS